MQKLKVSERNRFIEQVDEQINHMQENSYCKKEIAKFWKKHKEMYKMSREDLNVYYRNPYKFKQGKNAELYGLLQHKKIILEVSMEGITR